MSSSYPLPSTNSAEALYSSSTHGKPYEEVFLSFREEDTRATFTSHLYEALRRAGITVFRDDCHGYFRRSKLLIRL
ncbi:unnamed protein product [Trifolium pratense]|uniref:Uncharacterized protein n=1 Tax=Trifolium pratense TaxID=57577 RepID=A0ACB0L9D9_TRIPR|nr:unnamed protein product [Trifolium pratense]